MIAVVDYGVGNLFSLNSALGTLGVCSEVSDDPNVLRSADHVILPGVGAFGDAMDKLHNSGLDRVLIDIAAKGTPILGICLGMQLLFTSSEEFGYHKGLGLIDGRVVSLAQALSARTVSESSDRNNTSDRNNMTSDQNCYHLKVPHIGWNELTVIDEHSPLLTYIHAGERMYYVHSYMASDCEQSLVAVSEYGVHVPGIVQHKNVYGVQFHPEKSGDAGLRLLRAFVEVRA